MWRPLPSEEAARDRCLRPGIEAPDLVTVKDFLRFYIATSRPQLADIPTTESINAVAEWFFCWIYPCHWDRHQCGREK
jgi:hypothetical protein